MKITAILPVSRPAYFDRVINSLEAQTITPDALLVIYDGPDSGFIEVRNKVAGMKYENKLCVASESKRQAFSIPDRRQHITDIHNQFRSLIVNAGWIFSIEDDGILPANALEELIKTAYKHDDTGMVTGVELGRWGVPYVGAWTVDDVHNVKFVSSMENKTGQDLVEEIDACGLYCALIRADAYLKHEFFTKNGLGPDVNLGIYLRQCGYQNYINWNVPVTHLTNRNGVEMEIYPTDQARTVKLRLLSGSTWQSTR